MTAENQGMLTSSVHVPFGNKVNPIRTGLLTALKQRHCDLRSVRSVHSAPI